MNRAPIALCGLLCTLGSTLIAAGMAHDGSPCRFLPRPQPRIGVQATAPSRHPLANYDPTELWFDPAQWRLADLVPVERRHQMVVPSPVRREAAPLKAAAINPAVSRAVSLPVGHVAQSPLPATKIADLSLPRLVRAAELASQTEATLRWIAAQDGINDDSTGIYVAGSLKPLDHSVLNAFAKAGPQIGAITPWTVSLHVGPESAHVFDSNLGFDSRGVRFARLASAIEPTFWMDTQRQLAVHYGKVAKAAIVRVSLAADRLVSVGSGVVDVALATGRQLDSTAALIGARLPSAIPSWNLILPTTERPTKIGGKPAKLRSAKLPGATKK